MRQRWVRCIGAAIDGFEHAPPHEAYCIAASYGDTEAAVEKKVKYPQPDLPKRKGRFDKKSLGDVLGFRFTTTRWFRLEGGELSYYDDESMSPSSLRRVLPLAGAKLITGTDEHSAAIMLRLPGGRLLEMEASTMREAHEWKEAFAATISGLRAGARATYKNRRTNAFDTNDGEDGAASSSSSSKKPAVDRSRQHAVSTKDEATVRAIRAALTQHFCFRHISDIDPIIHAMKPKLCLPGEVVIWQGGPGNMFFFLEVHFFPG